MKLKPEAVQGAYARNVAAKMFGGTPRDWVRVAIEAAADLSGYRHLEVTDEMIDVATAESEAAKESGEGGVLDWTRAGLEAALALAPPPEADVFRDALWLVVHWPQVGDEVAESVWPTKESADEEARRLNDELGPGYQHYGYRPIAFGRPRDPELDRRVNDLGSAAG